MVKVRYIFASVILSCVVVLSKPEAVRESTLQPEEVQETNLTIADKWQLFENQVKSYVSSVVKMALPLLMENTGTLNLSSQCMRESMHLISGVKNIRPWAMRFLDSSAKIIDGILVGTLSSFGVFDECVETEAISSKVRDKGKVLFRGQYCSIDIRPPLPPKRNFYKLDEVLDELKEFSERGTAISESAKYGHFFHFLTLRLGVCVPSGCKLEDIEKLAKLLGNSLYLTATATRCEVKEEYQYTPLVLFVMCCYSLAGMLMLIGSFIDLYAYYRKVNFNSTGIRVLTAFSFFTNFRKLINTESSSNTLQCLSGVRFLSITWIVLGHTYLIANFQMFLGFEKVKAYAKDFAFQAVINASVAVDTFFFMGGLLVCYVMTRQVKLEGRPVNLILYIFHRLWRILPVYIFVIMFLFAGQILGSGPLWHDTADKFIQACYTTWWRNLVFINNFFKPDDMCLPHSWYIAVDFQLYLAALIILLPLMRWPKVGISLSLLSILASIIYSGVATFVNDYPPTMLFSHPDPDQRDGYWAHFYFRPFIHAGPYCIGILAGYLLAMKPDLKIPRKIQVLGWSLAFIFTFSVLYGVAEWNKGSELKFWESMFYASLNRVVWTLGVAWMIVCCATGHGGVINYILSWKTFVPLARLTFVVYLIHPLIQIGFIGNIRTRLQPDHFLYVWIYFGYLCITYATAFAGSMLIEAPFFNLEKVILPRNKKKEKDNSLGNENNILKGTLKTEKNGDIAAIVLKIPVESEDKDNMTVVYKL